jgi:hypothetical protein
MRLMGSKLTSVKVSIALPFIGSVEGTWEADERQRQAAWEMYVELATRISVVPLREDDGLLREALTSLYSLFGTTREILRRHGPEVARPRREGELSFGYLAVAVLNTLIRPLLATWHPELTRYEAQRPAERSVTDHERMWPKAGELRDELERGRGVLLAYAGILGQVAQVPSLLALPSSSEDTR